MPERRSLHGRLRHHSAELKATMRVWSVQRKYCGAVPRRALGRRRRAKPADSHGGRRRAAGADGGGRRGRRGRDRQKLDIGCTMLCASPSVSSRHGAAGPANTCSAKPSHASVAGDVTPTRRRYRGAWTAWRVLRIGAGGSKVSPTPSPVQRSRRKHSHAPRSEVGLSTTTSSIDMKHEVSEPTAVLPFAHRAVPLGTRAGGGQVLHNTHRRWCPRSGSHENSGVKV